VTALALQSWSQIRDDFSSHWLVFLSMPFTAAVIGYLTKLLAIEMLYRPIEFRGIGPIGWQGLVPRRAGAVAAIAIDTLTRNLLKPTELLDRIDPDEIAARLEGPLRDSVEEIAAEIANELRPGLWESLPQSARRALIDRARSQAPEAIGNLLGELRANLDQVVDIKYLGVVTLVRNKEKLNRLMRKTAGNAMVFVRRTGIVFGFAIGLIQMVAWGVIHNVWIMPAFGFITGFCSDWLALTMLFRPLEPRRYLGIFRWQGMLHAQREQITADYAQVVATDLFAPDVVLEAVLTGPGSDRLFALIQREVQRTLDEQTETVRPLVTLTLGTRRYQQLKRIVAQRVVERIPDTARELETYATETLAVERTIAEKMSALTTEEYEGILRPVFKDDEWLMITVGAILGFLVGELQVTLVTHLGGA
jgi:uncharacterized membrane protein YheB (UPF0754 family)